MELVPAWTVITRVRVTVQQRQTMIVWAMGAVAVDGLRVALVRIVRSEKHPPMASPLNYLGKDRPARSLVHRGKSLDRSPRLCRRRHPIMIAGHKVLSPVQLSGPRYRSLNRSECEVAKVQNNGIRWDRFVPPTDQFSIHLLDGAKRSLRQLADTCMPEMRVRSHEVDAVKVESWVTIALQLSQLWSHASTRYQTSSERPATAPLSRPLNVSLISAPRARIRNGYPPS